MNNLLTPNYPNGRNLFQGKNILVTAAAGSGIGFSTARRFLEECANIFISDVHEARLEQAIQTLQDLKLGEVDGCICNVTNDQEIDINVGTYANTAGITTINFLDEASSKKETNEKQLS